MESWILQAESGSNSKEGDIQGRSDQSAGRSTMAEAPRRRVRRKKCEAEERKHWDQHSKIPRRKPGKGIIDFLGLSESGKPTRKIYNRCETTPTTMERRLEAGRQQCEAAEEREQWDNVVDRWR